MGPGLPDAPVGGAELVGWAGPGELGAVPRSLPCSRPAPMGCGADCGVRRGALGALEAAGVLRGAGCGVVLFEEGDMLVGSPGAVVAVRRLGLRLAF